jgi:hypothetical protein
LAGSLKDPKEITWGNVGWIHLAQNRNWWWTLMKNNKTINSVLAETVATIVTTTMIVIKSI